MDNCITTWEMNLEPAQAPQVQEGVATGPFEPYKLDEGGLHWN